MLGLYQLVMSLVVWLYFTYCDAAGDVSNLAHLSDVLNLRAFAGQFWQEANGLAQWWAIIIDNLIDLIDPYPSIRGDH